MYFYLFFGLKYPIITNNFNYFKYIYYLLLFNLIKFKFLLRKKIFSIIDKMKNNKIKKLLFFYNILNVKINIYRNNEIFFNFMQLIKHQKNFIKLM